MCLKLLPKLRVLFTGYGMTWDDIVWHGMAWYGMVWHGMVLYGIAWYCMYGVWFGTIPYQSPSNCKHHRYFVIGGTLTLL